MSPPNFKNQIFSLLHVTQSIERTLGNRYGSPFWVKAEMNRLNFYSHSGHCYPDLVERHDGILCAQIRSVLWKDDYQRINAGFMRVLKEPLKDGINILFLARIQFDPVYGLSLRILDIDPDYSLGELEREKQETIRRLISEKLFDENRHKHLPKLPQRIAVISVETSKGFSDFREIIDRNPWGYRIFYMLFPALLQGENAVPSILGQFERIRKVLSHFDAVAIIRGGGGDVGLSCYNHYDLARTTATFPIPVITGIGHSTNETVTEMVAFKNAITPTDLAGFLIQEFHNFSVPLKDAVNTLMLLPLKLTTEAKNSGTNLTKYFGAVALHRIVSSRRDQFEQSSALVRLSADMVNSSRDQLLRMIPAAGSGSAWITRNAESGLREAMVLIAARCRRKLDQQNIECLNVVSRKRLACMNLLQQQKQGLGHVQKTISILNPEAVLNRGYSITLLNNKSIGNVEKVRTGDTITTLFARGKIISKVEKIKK